MRERGNYALRLADKYLGIPCISILGAAKFMRAKRKSSLKNGKSLKIALYCPGAIGDLLLASYLVNGIHLSAPEAELEILASPANAQALPFLLANKAAVFNIGRPDRLIRHVRAQKYDIFMDLNQWSRLGAVVAACSGARYAVGFKSSGQYRHMAYDKAIIHNDSIHEIANFCALGEAIWPGFKGAPGLWMPPPLVNGQKYICCHMRTAPGKFSFLKEWPEEYWAKFIEYLIPGYTVLLTGSKADLEVNKKFIKRYFTNNSRVNILEPGSLVQLAGVLRGAAAMVSVNTGVMHLAALMDVPTIALHGPTNPLRWGPFGRRCMALLPDRGDCAYLNLGFEYPAHAKSCMEFLSVSRVLDSLHALCPELDI